MNIYNLSAENIINFIVNLNVAQPDRVTKLKVGRLVNFEDRVSQGYAILLQFKQTPIGNFSLLFRTHGCLKYHIEIRCSSDEPGFVPDKNDNITINYGEPTYKILSDKYLYDYLTPTGIEGDDEIITNFKIILIDMI